MLAHSHGHGLVDIDSSIKETLKTPNYQCHLEPHHCIPGEGITVHGQELGLKIGMAPLPPPFLPGFYILRQVFTPHHAESLCNIVERTGTCVVWDAVLPGHGTVELHVPGTFTAVGRRLPARTLSRVKASCTWHRARLFLLLSAVCG